MSRYKPDQWVMLDQASVCIASGPHRSLRDGSALWLKPQEIEAQNLVPVCLTGVLAESV